MKNRIAIWTHGGIGGGFYSQGQPCIQKLVTQLSKEYEVDVYSLLPPNDEFEAETFRIVSMNKGFQWNTLRWSYLIAKFLVRHFSNRYHLLYSFWGYPSGVVVACLSSLLRRKSVIHLQGGDTACVPEISYGVLCEPFKKKFCKWAYLKASLVICLTEFQKGALTSAGIDRDVEIIPFGPDLEMFKFTNGRFSDESLRLIHVGNYTPVKDQRMLLDAFARIVNLRKGRLTIIGFDAMEGELQRYAKQLGVSHLTNFIEPIPHHQIKEYFSQADVIIQSSVYEGQGMAMSEAAACGVLLAGTRVGLLADLGNEYGVVVNVKDSEGLAAKLLNFMKDPDRSESCMRAAREWVEQHDATWTYETINSHLRRLIYE